MSQVATYASTLNSYRYQWVASGTGTQEGKHRHCSHLLLATDYAKANIKYTVFESEVSADTYRARQWGLSIHWSTPLLKKILPTDLWARIHEAWVDPSYDNPDVEYLNIYDATTGEKMNSMKEPHHMRFNRARMRKFCTQGIDVQVRCLIRCFRVMAE
jgi:hypothetical protein